jgi:serine/threonine-protein kinase
MSETILNGRYRLLTQYASGGMAVIYKATDLSLQRTVAVKILRPSLTVDPQFLARFNNEARAIANLAHPNIVTLHDVGTDTDPNGKITHYIIMEFVDGQDLKKIIRAQGALGVERALDFAIQICAGIGFAHRTGIVHADIKPQNILISKENKVKITDFGIAQAWSDTQPQQREAVVWGSPHYYAPEQAKGEKPSAASDVYSVGIVIFEMLTGRVPYLGASQQELALAHIRERIPLATEVNPTVSAELAGIVARAMAKEPHDRFRMADQLGQVLIRFREDWKGGKSPNTSVGAVGNSDSLTLPKVPSSPAPAQPQSSPQQSRPVPPVTIAPAQPVQTSSQRVPPPPPNSQQMSSSIPSAPTLPLQPPPPPNSPSGSSVPTQRYSPAPDAPLPTYPRQAGPQLQRVPNMNPAGRQDQQYAAAPVPQGNSGYVQAQPQNYNSQPLQPMQPPPSPFDSVTIALGVLAFIAVAFLLPLYLAVFSALS